MKKLRFYKNKKLDKIMAEEFLQIQKGGVDFGKGIIKLHPKLKPVKFIENITKKKNNIHLYFDNYYQTHDKAINHSIKNLQMVWRRKEKEFVKITENFFDNFPFPQGKYIAYASIINCNPRFLDSKTFQFFYKKPLAVMVYIVAHELLHFIFFDFIKKRLKKEISGLTEEKIWDLSEIFNVIVLESSRYQNIVDKQYILPYPNHKPLLSQFQKAYKKSCNAEEFIRQGINIMKTKK